MVRRSALPAVTLLLAVWGGPAPATATTATPAAATTATAAPTPPAAAPTPAPAATPDATAPPDGTTAIGPPSSFIVDLDATVLDLRATIVDLDAGTATTESTDETTITLQTDVFFDFDEHRLRPDARDTLTEVAERIGADGAGEVHIAGHTDAIGSEQYNQRLSERRAAAVARFLEQRLPGVTLTAEGFGEGRPVAPNETDDGEDNPEGRALNRRVELTYPR